MSRLAEWVLAGSLSAVGLATVVLRLLAKPTSRLSRFVDRNLPGRDHPMTGLWYLLGLCVWIFLAALVAPVIGRSIRNADRGSDDDWLADQPVEVLSPAEITRRAERMWLA